MRKLFKTPAHVSHAVGAILHLPLVERITHPAARRPIAACGAGIVLMLIGSTVAVESHAIVHIVHIPHALIDAMAYFTHGVGSVPIIRYIDPVWDIILGKREGGD